MTVSIIIPSALLILLLAIMLCVRNLKTNPGTVFISMALLIISIRIVSYSIGNFGGPVWLFAVITNNFLPFYYLIPVFFLFLCTRLVYITYIPREKRYLSFSPFYYFFYFGITILVYRFRTQDGDCRQDDL